MNQYKQKKIYFAEGLSFFASFDTILDAVFFFKNPFVAALETSASISKKCFFELSFFPAESKELKFFMEVLILESLNLLISERLLF